MLLGVGVQRARPKGRRREEKEKAGASGHKVDIYIIRSWEGGREEGSSLQVHEKAQCFLAFLLGRRCHRNVKI